MEYKDEIEVLLQQLEEIEAELAKLEVDGATVTALTAELGGVIAEVAAVIALKEGTDEFMNAKHEAFNVVGRNLQNAGVWNERLSNDPELTAEEKTSVYDCLEAYLGCLFELFNTL